MHLCNCPYLSWEDTAGVNGGHWHRPVVSTHVHIGMLPHAPYTNTSTSYMKKRKRDRRGDCRPLDPGKNRGQNRVYSSYKGFSWYRRSSHEEILVYHLLPLPFTGLELPLNLCWRVGTWRKRISFGQEDIVGRDLTMKLPHLTAGSPGWMCAARMMRWANQCQVLRTKPSMHTHKLSNLWRRQATVISDRLLFSPPRCSSFFWAAEYYFW